MEWVIRIFVITGFFILTGSLASLAGDYETDTDTINLNEFVVNENDTTEYELIIFDPRFSSWYVRESRPVDFYMESYLKRWNNILTDQWNQLVHSSRRRDCVPQVYLDYDTDIDYGMQFNHKLFYYFKHMHQNCRVFRNKPGGW